MHAQPGARSLRWYLVAMLLAVIATSVALVSAEPVMMVSSIIGWLLAATSVVLTGRLLSLRLREQMTVPSGKCVAGICILAIILLVASTCVLMLMWGAMQDWGKSAVARANLMGIGMAISSYRQNHDTYPDTLEDLVMAGLTAPKSMINPFDPDMPRLLPEVPPYYTSFVYTPSPERIPDHPELIIAYEKSAMTPIEPRVFTSYGRWVLFADGRVELLGEEDFQAALARDRELRSEAPSSETRAGEEQPELILREQFRIIREPEEVADSPPIGLTWDEVVQKYGVERSETESEDPLVKSFLWRRLPHHVVSGYLRARHIRVTLTDGLVVKHEVIDKPHACVYQVPIALE